MYTVPSVWRCSVAPQKQKGFTESYRAAPKGLPLFLLLSPKFRNGEGQVLTCGIKLLSMPLTSTRSNHESLEGGLNRRVLGCWRLKAVGTDSEGTRAPLTGRGAPSHSCSRERKGNLSKQECRGLLTSAELAFVNILAAKKNVAPSRRVWGEKW